MNFQRFRQNLGFLIGGALLSVLASSSTFAQEWPSVSGLVVNEFGDPLVDVLVGIPLYEILTGGGVSIGGFGNWQRQTDAEGRFSPINVMSAKSVRFVVRDEDKEKHILSIQMGGLTLYTNDRRYSDVIRFSLAEGMKIENAIITVKTDIQPQVRARVVFADGRPVTNAEIHTCLLFTDRETRRGYEGLRDTEQTDAEGYFMKNLWMDDGPRFYGLGVAYQGLFAKVPPFVWRKGQPHIHVLLTLNDNPIPPNERLPDQMFTELVAFMDPPTVWAVNPANGHAYKSIHCHSIADAMTQAAAENAYLVTINDYAESKWLKDIFGRERFWIGISDAKKEGQWQWHSGEPVTYTNWDRHILNNENTEGKDYAIFGFSSRWQRVAGGDTQVLKAILEKADVQGNLR